MIQATLAIGDFMLILLTTALVAGAQIGALALLGLAALGGGAWGARTLWRRRRG